VNLPPSAVELLDLLFKFEPQPSAVEKRRTHKLEVMV